MCKYIFKCIVDLYDEVIILLKKDGLLGLFIKFCGLIY